MIKYYCDICNEECSGSDKIIFDSFYGGKTIDTLCNNCYTELRDHFKDMSRRNPNSYIHNVDKLIKKLKVKYD